MKNARFEKLLVECKRELNRFNIPFYEIKEIEVNYRAKGRLGQCEKNRITNVFTINLSNELLKTDDMAIKDTIMHELLHTVDGCMNHGVKWKRYANMLNQEYGYSISRCASASEMGLVIDKTPKVYKYKVVCHDCGKTYHYQKKSKVIMNISKYRCGACQGRLEVFQIK